MPKNKKKQIPGMADAENAFKEIDNQEKAERRRLWLEEHKPGTNKPRGGEKDETGKET